MGRLAVVVLVLGLATSPGLRAQEQQPAEEDTIRPIGGLAFVDEIEVTVVNVVAYVTDKGGEAVTDLTAEDFRVFHDGQERPISNFQLYTEEVIRSFYESQEVPAAEPTTEAEGDQLAEIQPIYLMIYIDNDNLRPLDRNRVLSQARTFIRENARPPVKMMVVSFNKTLKVLQPFTEDSAQISNALQDVRMVTGGRTTRDSDRQQVLEEMERQTQGQGATQSNFQRSRGLALGFAEQETNDLQFAMAGLREAVNMMSGLPGKKMLLYISNGLPMVPGIDLFYALANTFDEPGLVTEALRFNQSRQFDSLVKNANAQGVTFYTIDASGLQNLAMGSAQYHAPRDTLATSMEHDNYLDSLRFMADETGGVAIFNTNDVRTSLDRVEQDFYSYYSLGYNLQTTGADRVHQVKVTIPDHPDYDIRYRRRFVEKSLASRVQDKVLTGLVIPFDENPLEVMVETGAQAPASSDRWTVPFELSFPLRNIALLPEGEDYVGRVSLFIAARDTGGKQSDVVRQEHEVRVAAADYDEAQRQRFTIRASLLMEPGTFKVSAGLLDQITRQSSFITTSVVVTE